MMTPILFQFLLYYRTLLYRKDETTIGSHMGGMNCHWVIRMSIHSFIKIYFCGIMNLKDAFYHKIKFGGMMAKPTVSLRLDKELVRQAEREAEVQRRSASKQVEYWATIGKILSKHLTLTDAVTISQGLKILKLEDPASVYVNPDDVLAKIDNDRSDGTLAEKVTAAPIYYEASISHPGYIDKVDSVTKERVTGSFENGEFKVLQ